MGEFLGEVLVIVESFWEWVSKSFGEVLERGGGINPWMAVLNLGGGKEQYGTALPPASVNHGIHDHNKHMEA